MKRSKFLKRMSISALGVPFINQINAMNLFRNSPNSPTKMPVLFMGHGNPMNAILDNEYTRTWHEMVKGIPKPSAILCISAHWETTGTKITAMENPKMIYDMYGFPKELYEVKYPSPGKPELANEIVKHSAMNKVMPDMDWGLDHGAWSILVKMYPDAGIPCLQLSLNKTRDLQWHYEFAKQLNWLRNKGVLIVGSGNIVHNLQYAQFGRTEPYEWAAEFDTFVKTAIEVGNHESLVNYQQFGKSALLSVNSAEHYIPMIYALALQDKNEKVSHFNEGIDFGSGGMRCLKIG